MRQFIDVTGKTEEEAINRALEQLKLDRDDVSVEILERAKAGFLGLGSCPAKVRVSYGEDEEPAAPAQPKAEKVREDKPKTEKPRTEKKPAEKPQRREEPVKKGVRSQDRGSTDRQARRTWARRWMTSGLRRSASSFPAPSADGGSGRGQGVSP